MSTVIGDRHRPRIGTGKLGEGDDAEPFDTRRETLEVSSQVVTGCHSRLLAHRRSWPGCTAWERERNSEVTDDVVVGELRRRIDVSVTDDDESVSQVEAQSGVSGPGPDMVAAEGGGGCHA